MKKIILFLSIFTIFSSSVFSKDRLNELYETLKFYDVYLKKHIEIGTYDKNTRKLIILGTKKIFEENELYCNEISDLGFDIEQNIPFVTCVDEVGNESKIFFDKTLLNRKFKLKRCGIKKISNFTEDVRHCKYHVYNNVIKKRKMYKLDQKTMELKLVK